MKPKDYEQEKKQIVDIWTKKGIRAIHSATMRFVNFVKIAVYATH